MYVPVQKIEGVVSDDPHREALRHVRLNPETKSLEATNGKALVVLPIELEDGEEAKERFFSSEDIKRARKAGGRYARARLSEVPAGFGLADGSTIPAQSLDGPHYPDFSAVVPKPGNRPPDIYLDAELLLAVARGLSASKDHPGFVGLWFAKKEGQYEFDDAIYVRACEGDGYGVVMPLTRRDMRHELTPHNLTTEEIYTVNRDAADVSNT